jgi:glycosidase
LANTTLPPANTTLSPTASLAAVPRCRSTLRAAHFSGPSSWNDAYQAVVWPTVRGGSRVSVNLADFSRLVSDDMMRSAASRARMAEYILALPPDVPFIWQNTVGGATRRVPAGATAVHPAWRRAFAFVDVPVFGPWQGTTPAQAARGRQVVANATAVFGAAAYYNEDYGFEESWQESMFGASYGRLLAVKRRVDPGGAV